MASGTLPEYAQFACVVYEPKTGDIRHVHRVVVLPGAEPPIKEEMKERALALAKKLGGDTTLRLEVLHVPPEAFKRGSKHKVDVKNLTLIAEPLPRR